jgi:DNA-directed RNA polymerase specialized sigma24 family protein
MHQTGNADTAADLTQASFERVLAHATSAEIRSPRGLLFQTARNLLIDAFRLSSDLGYQYQDLEGACQFPRPSRGSMLRYTRTI